MADRMTALAKLPEKWRAAAQALRDNPSYYVEIRSRGVAAAYDNCADELTASLSPAELGGVEAVAVADCDGRFVEIKALTPAYGLPVGKHNLYTTPRAAEAVTEEMVERACIEDASESYPYTWDHLPDSVKVRRRKRMTEILASALTPPSAKGE